MKGPQLELMDVSKAKPDVVHGDRQQNKKVESAQGIPD